MFPKEIDPVQTPPSMGGRIGPVWVRAWRTKKEVRFLAWESDTEDPSKIRVHLTRWAVPLQHYHCFLEAASIYSSSALQQIMLTHPNTTEVSLEHGVPPRDVAIAAAAMLHYLDPQRSLDDCIDSVHYAIETLEDDRRRRSPWFGKEIRQQVRTLRDALALQDFDHP